jgi:hypothetical protein
LRLGFDLRAVATGRKGDAAYGIGLRVTRLPCWRLSIGFGAVADGVDDEGVVGFFGEADAVVADAEAKLFGVALELLDVALAGLGEAVESGENPHGVGAVDAADIGAWGTAQGRKRSPTAVIHEAISDTSS